MPTAGGSASLDIVEINPALDVRNQTALLVVDLVESLFGKSTLMRARSARALKVSPAVPGHPQLADPHAVELAGRVDGHALEFALPLDDLGRVA